MAKNIYDAQEIYYLANGHYSNDFENLDVQLPAGKNETDSSPNSYIYDWGMRCSFVSSVLILCEDESIKMQHQIYISHPTETWKEKANVHVCVAEVEDLNAPQNQICKAETGNTEPMGSSAKSYEYIR